MIRNGSFQPRNGSIGIGIRTDPNTIGSFNPATVRLELCKLRESLCAISVSTPQRFDWNQMGDRKRPENSSFNPATVRLESRIRGIIEAAPVSTPQRFDWNFALWTKRLDIVSFNPATVRLESVVTVKTMISDLFQPRNGSIGIMCGPRISDTGGVSTPQRFDWNMAACMAAAELSVSTPQRFDWNKRCHVPL